MQKRPIDIEVENKKGKWIKVNQGKGQNALRYSLNKKPYILRALEHLPFWGPKMRGMKSLKAFSQQKKKNKSTDCAEIYCRTSN